MRAKNFYVYRDNETNPDEFLIRSFYSNEVDKMFDEICRTIAFADLTGYDVDEIVVNGRRVRYVGWQPDMHITLRYCDNDEIAWDAYYPELDH